MQCDWWRRAVRGPNCHSLDPVGHAVWKAAGKSSLCRMTLLQKTSAGLGLEAAGTMGKERGASRFLALTITDWRCVLEISSLQDSVLCFVRCSMVFLKYIHWYWLHPLHPSAVTITMSLNVARVKNHPQMRTLDIDKGKMNVCEYREMQRL